MTHSYHLKAVECRIWGAPNLFIRPAWAHRDTLQESLSVPYGTPNFGLANVALHARVDAMMDRLEFSLVAAPVYMQTLTEHNATNREFRATHQALADLQRSIGDRIPTIGERCAAWCETFDMPGVLLPRASGDESSERYWLARNVKAAVDRYLEAWEQRAREECMPEAYVVDALGELAMGGLR